MSAPNTPEPARGADYVCPNDGTYWTCEHVQAPRRSLTTWLDGHPRLVPVYSHGYRILMRLLHRWRFCWAQPVDVEPGMVWCHWCGMRGKRVMPGTHIDGCQEVRTDG